MSRALYFLFESSTNFWLIQGLARGVWTHRESYFEKEECSRGSILGLEVRGSVRRGSQFKLNRQLQVLQNPNAFMSQRTYHTPEKFPKKSG